MKKLIRSKAVQTVLGVLVGAWLALCYATMRCTVVGRENAEKVWNSGEGAIVPFWHARIALSRPAWDPDAPQKPAGLISLSPDGEFFSHSLTFLNVAAIRGSTSKRTRSGRMKNKGGSEAFRGGLKWVEDGNVLAITPDGPRGPARRMTEGAVMLAQLSGRPVLMLGMASKPCIRLKTWDRMIVPLPFSRLVLVWAEPFVETTKDTGAETGAWEARLNAVTERAEALIR